MSFKKAFVSATALLVALFSGLGSAWAAGEYMAEPKQLGFMQPATEVMRDLVWFHDGLLWMCIIITIFVMVLMLYIMFKFNAKSNPNPSKTTHNTLLEVVWTTVPILILIVIAVPSFKLLYKQDMIPEADVTVKAIGNQWYWSYEYPDYEDLSFDAVMLTEEDKSSEDYSDRSGTPRLLETDTHVVVPVNKVIRVQTTATDVIHAWTIPAFGVKVDAVPGRLNELWFKAEKEGIYYGQCSELCGIRHGFMPIVVEVVSQEVFDAWVKNPTETAAKATDSNIQVADATQAQ
ncbi:cytochrome c oxidase subunit II [Emcibacter sp.]|uniref:cytochrome c oxidase subunit II n=1 Tax=Emcibacter sp. TaxID=1979954 RepID=UPI002AA7B762|nr:cytochrome c oxidase subunit II [Emcibacter sp.]